MKKYLLFFAALLFAGLTLTSCDPNGVNGGNATEKALIGKWAVQSVDIVEIASGNVVESHTAPSADTQVFEFLSDGKFVVSGNGETTGRGTWELKHDLLVLYVGSSTTVHYTVKEVTSKELTLRQDIESATTVYYVYHYAKVL